MRKAQLVYIGTNVQYETKVFPIEKEITTIGRLGEIELPEDDWINYIGEGHDEVRVKKSIRTSRMHARILKQDGRFVLEDIGSKVGTYVNGNKLGEPQKEPWKVRYCHSSDYYPVREPKIRDDNKGSIELHNRDLISLGQEMYEDRHTFRFELL